MFLEVNPLKNFYRANFTGSKFKSSTFGPLGISPNHFFTKSLVSSILISPAITKDALLAP